MPAHNIAHCNTPSGIAKRSRVYVPRIAADKCRAYAEFVRFIAKRDTCYGTRDTEAIAQPSPPPCPRGAHPRCVFSHYFPRDNGDRFPGFEKIHPQAHRWSFISHQRHCSHDVILFLPSCSYTLKMNKSSRYIYALTNIYIYNLFLSRSPIFIFLVFIFFSSTLLYSLFILLLSSSLYYYYTVLFSSIISVTLLPVYLTLELTANHLQTRYTQSTFPPNLNQIASPTYHLTIRWDNTRWFEGGRKRSGMFSSVGQKVSTSLLGEAIECFYFRNRRLSPYSPSRF